MNSMPLAVRSALKVSFCLKMSARWSSADLLRFLEITSRTSAGNPFHAFAFARNQKPSHMWFVSERYFCTSNSFAKKMIESGFSCPSATLVCSAEYTSEKLIDIGAASNALNIEVQSGLGGTRILKPLRSSGLLIGRVEDVISR